MLIRYSAVTLLAVLILAPTAQASPAVNGKTFVMAGNFWDKTRERHSPLAYHTTDAGKTWQLAKLFEPQNKDTHVIKDVACDAAGTKCNAVGYSYNSHEGVDLPINYSSFDGGSTWYKNTVPQITDQTIMTHVACAAIGNSCVVLGYEESSGTPLSYVTSDSGKSWKMGSIPHENYTEFQTLRCDATVKHCVATSAIQIDWDEDKIVAYFTNDGGNNWQISKTTPVIKTAEKAITDIACSEDAMHCAALGLTTKPYSEDYEPVGFVTTDGGNNWKPSKSMPVYDKTFSSHLDHITCDKAGKECVAVGTFLDNSRRYKRQTLFSPISYISHDGGNNWSLSAEFPAPLSKFFSYTRGVACENKNCLIVGLSYDPFSSEFSSYFNGYYSTDGGQHWASSADIAQPATGDDYSLINNLS